MQRCHPASATTTHACTPRPSPRGPPQSHQSHRSSISSSSRTRATSQSQQKPLKSLDSDQSRSPTCTHLPQSIDLDGIRKGSDGANDGDGDGGDGDGGGGGEGDGDVSGGGGVCDGAQQGAVEGGRSGVGVERRAGGVRTQVRGEAARRAPVRDGALAGAVRGESVLGLRQAVHTHGRRAQLGEREQGLPLRVQLVQPGQGVRPLHAARVGRHQARRLRRHRVPRRRHLHHLQLRPARQLRRRAPVPARPHPARPERLPRGPGFQAQPRLGI